VVNFFFANETRKPMTTRILVAMLLAVTLANAQTDDRRYFDFWEGTWVQEVDGKPDTSKTVFRVTRSVNRNTFEEDWKMVLGATTMRAKGVRAWDDSTKAWPYLWISDAGHYQIWDGRKADGNWYIYRHFDFGTDKYLSRQAWIPESPTRLMRVSEKSYDEGKTWELRFKEYYQRVK